MKIDICQGWLVENQTVTHIPSPNFDQRPISCEGEVSLLVIHHISLPPHQFGSDDIEAFFTNSLDVKKDPFYQEIQALRVSAHAFIKRNGAVVQFVNFDRRAWHAGESCYRGRKACNNFSIGIELEGDEMTPYRYAQYKSLIALTIALKDHYPQIGDRITGHENIAPNRKTDPGPFFDWRRYLESVRELAE